MTIQAHLGPTTNATGAAAQTRESIQEAKAAIDSLYASIQQEVNKHRVTIDELVFSRADQAIGLLREHGLDSLKNPDSAAIIYDAISHEVSGLDDVETALNDTMNSVPFYSGFERFYQDEATGYTVPIFSLSVPEFPSNESIDQTAEVVHAVLQAQRSLVSTTWLDMEIENSYSNSCFVRADDNGYCLAKGDPTGISQIKIGPLTEASGLATILREVALRRTVSTAAFLRFVS